MPHLFKSTALVFPDRPFQYMLTITCQLQVTKVFLFGFNWPYHIHHTFDFKWICEEDVSIV